MEWLIVLAFVACVIVYARHRAAKVREVFARAAQRLGGRVDGAGGGAWWAQLYDPTIELPLRGGAAFAHIRFERGSGKNAPIYTIFTAPNTGGCRLYLRRQGVLDALGAMLGAVKDLRVGDSAFDELFVVQSDHEERAKTLLGRPDIQELVHGLLKVDHRDYLVIARDEHGLRVTRRDEILDEEKLVEFARLSLSLHGKLGA